MVESISTECAYTAPWSSSSPPPAFIPLTPKSTNPFNFNLNLNHQIESESESYPYPSGKALTENTTTIQTRPTSPVTSSSKNVNPSPPSTLPLHLYKDLPTHLLQPDGTPDYLRMILSADIYSLVKTTPLTPATNLSAKLGCEVLLKREDLQPVFSFKLRGAFNMMRQLEGEQKWKGVVACSAGNHAQGVALSGLHLSIPCTIVMPMGTPKIKYENVARLGAKVVLHGQDFDEAKTECSRLALAYGLTIIPPFDEPRVIAGQGTVGVEICRQTDMSKVDVVFACVGGGGLLAGMAAYIKRIAPPHVKVIGVETFDGDALARSLQADRRVTLDEVGLFADGTAVKTVGEECFRICRDLVDGVVRVGTDEICAAIRDTFEDTRSIPEPSGALALAGLKRYVAEHNLRDSGKRFVAVVSGANMNFSRLRFVAERADLGDRNEVLLCVEIPEKEGSFLKLHNHIHPRAITEFSYRYRSNEKAFIYLSFLLGSSPSPSTATPSANETPKTNGSLKAPSAGPASTSTSQSQPIPPPTSSETPPPPVAPHRSDEVDHLLQNLEKDGMPAMDISDNEFAKSHARYLVGGRAEVTDERVFRFEFPERPGALRKFLQGLHAGWNISLFHYRNQGSDVGRVLAGIQVERTEKAQQGFQKWLDHELGYPYVEETKNAVYERFLR